MYFTKATFILSLAVSALALPITDSEKQRRAATGTSAAVLTKQSYVDFQVSDGVGGNALAEVEAKFPIDESNLAGVAASDVTIINSAHTIAEDAEIQSGGFDDAITAAGSSSAAGKALQVGKIKNKVLKLKLEILGLQIEQAQTGKDNTASIAAETTKLNNNIALDTAAKGQTSQSIDFSGTD